MNSIHDSTQKISFAEQYDDIKHQLDMWHGSKNLGKKLHAVSIGEIAACRYNTVQCNLTLHKALQWLRWYINQFLLTIGTPQPQASYGVPIVRIFVTIYCIMLAPHCAEITWSASCIAFPQTVWFGQNLIYNTWWKEMKFLCNFSIDCVKSRLTVKVTAFMLVVYLAQ